jgi:hypothetical protein
MSIKMVKCPWCEGRCRVMRPRDEDHYIRLEETGGLVPVLDMEDVVCPCCGGIGEVTETRYKELTGK